MVSRRKSSQLEGLWVIPNHFNKSFYMTLSELDETWHVSSTCGFMKPDGVSLLFVVWLLGKGLLNIKFFLIFAALATI